jgi:hypothetical protein
MPSPAVPRRTPGCLPRRLIFLCVTALALGTPPAASAAVNFTVSQVTVGTGPNSVAVGDVNGDGKQDLVVVNRTAVASVSVMLGDGLGGFSNATGSPITLAAAITGAIGDFNHDGKQDLAIATASAVQVLLGVGDGTFGAPTSNTVGAAPSSIAIRDVNADGIQDMATSNRTGANVSVLLGVGDGTFSAHTDFVLGPNASYPQAVALADLNGDGRPDLVVGNGYIPAFAFVLLNTTTALAATPTFTTHIDYATFGNYADSLAVGDFNGDSTPDVVTGHNSGGWGFLRGTGGGAFAPATGIPGAVSGEGIVAADLDGDGNLDLASAQSGVSHAVGLELGNGAGIFSSLAVFPVSNVPSAIASGDFNRDGATDLVTANFQDATGSTVGHQATILLNRPVLQAAGADFGSLTTGTTSGILPVRFTNNGAAPQTIDVASATITGTAAGDYAIASDGCSGTTLGRGRACNVLIQFSPSATGVRNASVSLTGSPLPVPSGTLTGTGLAPLAGQTGPVGPVGAAGGAGPAGPGGPLGAAGKNGAAGPAGAAGKAARNALVTCVRAAAKKKPARRPQIVCTITVSSAFRLRARARLTLHGRTVASRTGVVGPGRAVLQLRPRGGRPGRYLVRVGLRGPAGSAVTQRSVYVR